MLNIKIQAIILSKKILMITLNLYQINLQVLVKLHLRGEKERNK